MQSIHTWRPRATLVALAWMTALALLAPAALAKKDSDKPAQATTAKSRKPPKVKMENGSGESTAERDRRLFRECKGRPNAGACAGYTG
jgi:hypothetical protein